MPDYLYAEIILPLALESSFTYKVGEELRTKVKIGSRVIVEFGNRRKYSGVIVRLHNDKPLHNRVKEILGLAEFIEVINEKQLDLWKWMSEYYMCTMGEILDAALPSGLRIIKTNSTSYSIRTRDYISLGKDYSEKQLGKILDSFSKAPARARLLLKYLELSEYESAGSKPLPVERASLLRQASTSNSVLNILEKSGVLRRLSIEESRLPDLETKTVEPFKLSEIQDGVKQSIEDQLKGRGVALLHGVTSSGKTEIYIHLIEEQVNKGKQVLYLLPEIALTSQIINRLRKHFGNWVGVYHSKFNDSERVEVWRRVAGEIDGMEYKIILGVRSSIFLPFSNLGLIIIDEEHDNSYKQIDPAPRYNARDVSTMLARIHNASVLMGSATPSLESRFNAENGKYGYAELNHRFGDVQLPEIVLADTAAAYKKKIMVSHFTPVMLESIESALSRKEQVILLRNRRGFAPYIQCRDCGWIPQCNNCSVSLTYHKTLNRLNCHHCGNSSKIDPQCQNCSSPDMIMRGYGTERIEDELRTLYPKVRIVRMDIDTTRRKGAFNKIISDFENGKTDILLGTQMISKGLDFENLTLVGILNVDNMLNFPDFRSHEKCFQLIEQVSGRAGRREKRGTVIIQTFEPGHSVMKQVLNHNYMEMYRSQLNERKEFGYPPYTRLIKVIIKHKDRKMVQEISTNLAVNLRSSMGSRVLGPEFPLLSKIQNYYIMTILLKIERETSITKAKMIIAQILNSSILKNKTRSLRIYADVDPL